MTTLEDLEREYCIHAQAATMLWNVKELTMKYFEDPGNVEVMSEDPYCSCWRCTSSYLLSPANQITQLW